jgi:hypothetical protein
MRKYIQLVWAGVLGCALLPGCISHEETVSEDEPRVRVEFENDTAGRLFYEKLSRVSASHSGKIESSTHVQLPVIFDHKRKVVRGANRAFNEAVRVCDTNGDGRITELEARIYSEAK